MLNPFELFDLPIDFNVDQTVLSTRYLALQKTLHPDNFAHASAQEQRIAMQKSAEVNDALQILKDPIARADSIIALNIGEQQNLEENSTHDVAFLMQQLEWREQLESIENAQDLDGLMVFSTQIESEHKNKIYELSTALSNKDWEHAQILNDRLRFIKKLMVDIEHIEEKLTEF
ncbi:Fe-S protein assembly co-chaperone HscB [Mannheimia massilioguelmaensis]|uniref:Fe-S protein assembly co-chaperone HscB n=1 Tax=Mannheimia massilioguelmaensis TaxID=1604354 RepID=UPI0005C9D6B5|nr:Fe-S protein assembly co-chaperone HscB [Mannheimia massilioguelmaensis]